MPYCPKCATEYRTGFTRCADCGVELLAARPPQPPQSHDHHAEAPGIPAPTSTLFPTAPVAPPAVDETEDAGDGFVLVGDRAWVYSANSGAEAWFLRALYRSRGIAAQIDFLGSAQPAPFRVLVPAAEGHAALKTLDEFLGTWECPRCGELGPAPSPEFPLCLACSLPPA